MEGGEWRVDNEGQRVKGGGWRVEVEGGEWRWRVEGGQ